MITILAIIIAVYIAIDVFMDRRMEKRLNTLEEAVATMLLELDMLEFSEADFDFED